MPRRSSNGHGPSMATGPVAVVEHERPAPVPETVAARRQRGEPDPTLVHGLITAAIVVGLGALLAALMLSGTVAASESTATPWAIGIIALGNAAGWLGGWVMRRRRARRG